MKIAVLVLLGLYRLTGLPTPGLSSNPVVTLQNYKKYKASEKKSTKYLRHFSNNLYLVGNKMAWNQTT